MATLIAHAQLPATPWKNGAGSTTEIAVAPPGAGFDDFDWRISLATIAADGPFSTFAGIDRSLALVEGDGVALTFDNERRVVLDGRQRLVRFAGEAAVFAEVASASTDFNVMTRRGRCRHQLDSLTAPAALTRRGATTVLFLAAGAQLTVAGGEQVFVLRRFDALLLDGGDASQWHLDGAGTVLVADLMPV